MDTIVGLKYFSNSKGLFFAFVIQVVIQVIGCVSEYYLKSKLDNSYYLGRFCYLFLYC